MAAKDTKTREFRYKNLREDQSCRPLNYLMLYYTRSGWTLFVGATQLNANLKSPADGSIRKLRSM